MGHLFLDIETYSSPAEPDSSLNPYLGASKVIVIAFNYYPGFRPPSKDQIKPATFLKEWESDERSILSQFFGLLKQWQRADAYLKISGFNILKFDLPYLFGRMRFHKLASDDELHDLLFRPFGTDLYQVSALISPKTKEHEQLWGINHKQASAFFNLKVKEATGLDCSKFYDAKEYDKIMRYCNEEFNLEQLFDAFYLHIIGR
ncbi:hypothetical protein HY642_02115 [Candidatus Woesearchaeota archaeon]|nr:hypothetical protein [Candidatus Woesearchaeota archaeon]